MRYCLSFLLLTLFCGLAESQIKIIVEYNYSFANMQNLSGYVVEENSDSYFFFSKEENMSYANMQQNNFKGLNPYHVYHYEKNKELISQIVLLVPQKINLSEIPRIAEEKLNDLKWKIGNERKKILNYEAISASTDFRGRKYKVWFTKDLPYQVFPWKLKGLPGVILEFEDEDGFIKGTVRSVIINPNNAIMPNKILDFFETNKTKKMSFNQLVNLENEFLQENMNKMISQLPKGTQYEVPNLREMSLEKSFEWEKTAPQKSK